MSNSRFQFKSAMLLCLLVPAVFGCSDVERLELPKGTAEGSVTYKGKPVPYALVIFSGENTTATANADAQGNYKMEYVPAGTLDVGVNTDAGRGIMMSAMMAAGQDKDSGREKPSFVDVPKKYFDPQTSGITVTTTEGANKLDIVVE